MPEAIVFRLSTAPAVLDASDAEGLTFEKEIIYVDDFDATAHGGSKFSVDEPLLLHWQRTIDEMLQDGEQIPLPIEHTEDPEKSRGLVLGSRVGPNMKGKPALFAKVKFRDAEAAKLAKTTQVSLYQPLTWVNGKGKRYYRPIRHIALTDYPVVPGLEPFKAIVASLTGVKKKMSMSSLAESIGISVADKEEAALEAEIVSVFKDMQREIESLKAKPNDGEGEGEGEEIEASLGGNPMIVNMVRENRKNKIAGLLNHAQGPKIVPAVATKLEEQYCSDAALKLSLSGKDDGFDNVIATLSLNDSVAPNKGRTGGQTLKLSGGSGGSSDNPVIAEAKRRAEEAKSRR